MKCQRFKSRQQRALDQADHRRDHFLHTTRGRSLRSSLERWTFSHFTDPCHERWPSAVQNRTVNRDRNTKRTQTQSPENRAFDPEVEKHFAWTTDAWESSNIFDLLGITDEDVDRELRLRIERILRYPTTNSSAHGGEEMAENKRENDTSEEQESSTLAVLEETSTGSLQVENECKNPYLNYLKKKSRPVEEPAVEASPQRNVDPQEDSLGYCEEVEANVEESDEVEVSDQDNVETEMKAAGDRASPLNVESDSEKKFLAVNITEGNRALKNPNNEEARDFNGEKATTEQGSSIKSVVNIMKAAAIQKSIVMKKRRKKAKKKNVEGPKAEDTLEHPEAVLEALEGSTVLKLFRDYLRFERPDASVPLKSDAIFQSSILPE